MLRETAGQYGRFEMPPASLSSAAYAGAHARRRLAAITFADIVGYSVLMAQDETRTHTRWMTLLSEVVRPKAEQYHGKIVKSTGDGVLAEFPSALDAVEWSQDLQHQVQSERSEESGTLSPIVFRIAVHLGDVMATADDIYGDGVNVAARLVEFAEPGGIVLSEAVYDLVRGTVGPRACDLGTPASEEFREACESIRSRSREPGAPPSDAVARQRTSVNCGASTRKLER